MPIADLLKALYPEEEEKKPNLLGTVIEHAFPIKKAVGLVKGVGESMYRQMDYMMSLSQMQMTNATLDGQRNLTLKEKVQVNQELALETSKFALYYGGPAGKAISGTIKNVAKGVSPIARRGWQKFLRRVFGEKWNKQQLDVLWNKINSPTAKFTDAEVSAIAEMKKISQTTGTSMGKLFAKEKLWLDTKTGIYTDIQYGAKGLQFRPKPPISDKTYDLKKIITKPTKSIISEKAVTKPEPTPVPKPKPLTPDEIEIIRHPPGRIVKEPIKVPETPTVVPPAPGIEKVITPYVPKKPVVKPTPPTPEEIGRPPEEVGGLPFTKHIIKKGLPTKVSKLFPLTPKGLTIERVEKKIITAYEGGYQQGLKVFNQAKQAGIIETKETFEERIANIKEKTELKKRFNKARKELQGIDVKHLRPEYQKDVKQVLDQLDLTKPRTGTIYRLEEMRKYVETHPDNNIPSEKLKQLDRLSKTPIQDLTVENVEDITKHVRHFVHLNKLKNKLIFGKQYRDAKEVVNVARVNIQSKRIKAVGNPNVIDSGVREPHKGLVGKIFSTDSYNPELISTILDRKRGGIIHNVMYKGIDKGVSEQMKYAQDAGAFLLKDISKAGINPEKDLASWSRSIGGKKAKIQTVKLPDGRVIKLTKADRVAIILHSMNDKNLRHLLSGGFSFEAHKGRIYKITENDLRTIIASSTPQERQVAVVFSRFFNQWQKVKLNEMSLELNGWEIATEKNYYPIRTNILDRKRDYLKPRKNFTQATLEGMGILKERTNAKNAIVIEDAFTTLFKNIKQTSAYYGLAKPLRNAKMLLMNNEFQKDIIKHYGRHYLKSLDNYIKRLEDNSHNTENVEQLATQLVNKMDLAILGANPFVMLKQPVSYMVASTEIDTKYLLRAMGTRVNREEISKWSPQLRDRLEGNVTRELGELGQVGAVRKFFTGKSPHSHKLMAGIRFFDTQTIGRIWNATKFEIKAKQPNLKGNDYMKAVADRAEEVIRLTQPTWHVKDRSAIGRSQNIFIRLLTKYTSQRNKNYNIMRRAILEYDTSGHTVKDKSKVMKKLFIATVMSAVAIAGIDEARNKLYKRKPQTLLARAIKVFGNTMSYTYFVGDMFNSLASKVERGTYAGWDVNNPLSSFVDNTLDAIAGGTRAIDQLVKQEEYKAGKYRGEKKFKRTAIKAADQAARSIGMIYGIPYATLRKLLGAGVGWVREEEPEPTKKSKNISDKLKELYK